MSLGFCKILLGASVSLGALSTSALASELPTPREDTGFLRIDAPFVEPARELNNALTLPKEPTKARENVTSLVYLTLNGSIPMHQKLLWVERWCNQIINDQVKLIDGRWYIDFYNGAFLSYFGRRIDASKKWDQDLEFIRAWKTLYPKSRCAPIIETQFWSNLAWLARGNGYIDTVSPEAWALFSERSRLADAALDASAEIAKFNPSWYSYKITLGRYLQSPKDDLFVIVKEGLKRFPDYFTPAATMTTNLQPRWGGSWEELVEFVDDVVKVTPEKDKAIVYTRLFSVIYRENRDFVRNGMKNWPRMLVGLEAMVQRFPKSNWTINNYAALACAAGDKSTYIRLRPQISAGKHFDEAFLRNHSIETCDARFLFSQSR
jgi:hypothetical protein